jgi:hypothetical protein
MGTAYWNGISVSQLIDPRELPRDIVEMAVLRVDGHGDSVPLDYATSGDVLLAPGMNGNALLKTPLPRFTWTQWKGEITAPGAIVFPSGPQAATIRRRS